MEKFILLIREDLVRREQNAEEARQAVRAMTKWVESLAQSGNLVTADALKKGGTYVGKDYVLSDGPFIEAKEAISGFVVINAETAAQATSIAQTCPLLLQGLAVLEVRPVLIFDNNQLK